VINWLKLMMGSFLKGTPSVKSQKIMITGPQGSGKTTQAKKIAKKIDVYFVGAGDLLRQFAKESSGMAAKVKNDLESGRLVDNEIIGNLLRKTLSQPEYRKGFVADGYPRSLSQLEVYNPDYDRVVYLKVSDEEAERRLLDRSREDDTSEAIKERLSWYHKETAPLLEYYQKQKKLVTIDGERSIEEVAADIEDKLRVEGKND